MATGDQIQIPCVMMRGGTSRGPFFLASDLPADPHHRDAAAPLASWEPVTTLRSTVSAVAIR